jgi:urocanate hydratase
MTIHFEKDASAAATLRARRGSALSCKSWEQEAALRMLINSADPEVAERPPKWLMTGNELLALESDQTLVLSSGLAGPTGRFRPQAPAPRVVIAADRQDNASAANDSGWLYVGTQTSLPIAYEALGASARKYFAGTLAGRLVAVCGLGWAGGAQPVAATFNGAAVLGIDADAEKIKRRLKTGYCEVMVNDLSEALRILKNSVRTREPASVGLIGNCAQVIPELASRGVVPDMLLDSTLGDPLSASYIPRGLSAAQAAELLGTDAQVYRERTLESIEAQVASTLELQRLGSLTYRLGGELRVIDGTAIDRSLASQYASKISDYSAEFIEPLLAGGRSLMLWVALSGEPADVARADKLALEIFSADEFAARFIQLAARHVQFQGLPARICLVDRALQAKFGVALNAMVAQGVLRAPMVIGCDDPSGSKHAAFESPASEHAERGWTEAQFHALLAGLSARERAASWVAVGSDGDASFNPGLRLAIVADGTPEMAGRIARVLGPEK